MCTESVHSNYRCIGGNSKQAMHRNAAIDVHKIRAIKHSNLACVLVNRSLYTSHAVYKIILLRPREKRNKNAQETIEKKSERKCRRFVAGYFHDLCKYVHILF